MSDTKKGEYAKQNRSYQDKLIPSSNASFVEKVYDKMLKRSGREISNGFFDAHAESRKINKIRPEYTGVFRNPLA